MRKGEGKERERRGEKMGGSERRISDTLICDHTPIDTHNVLRFLMA